MVSRGNFVHSSAKTVLSSFNVDDGGYRILTCFFFSKRYNKFSILLRSGDCSDLITCSTTQESFSCHSNTFLAVWSGGLSSWKITFPFGNNSVTKGWIWSDQIFKVLALHPVMNENHWGGRFPIYSQPPPPRLLHSLLQFNRLKNTLLSKCFFLLPPRVYLTRFRKLGKVWLAREDNILPVF